MDKLSSWYLSEGGQQLAHAIGVTLLPLTDSLKAWRILHISPPQGLSTHPCFPHSYNLVQHSPSATHDDSVEWGEAVDVIADPAYLPYSNETFDLIIVSHALEGCDDRTAFLSELHRVLTHAGRVIFIGFNPWSLAGLSRLYFRARGQAWPGRWLSTMQLTMLLEDHAFICEQSESFFYRPLCRTRKWMNRFYFIEAFGEFTALAPGSAYAVCARKQLAPLTPIRAMFTFKRFVFGRVVPDLSAVHPHTFGSVRQEKSGVFD